MRIVIVGEGMLELSRVDATGWRLGHGGDTLNAAIHLARFGADVAYATALGDDPFNNDIGTTAPPAPAPRLNRARGTLVGARR